MNLDSAISKHAEWKTKFRSAITNKEKLDTATIRRDDCCELGKWLHGEGKISHRSYSSYAAVVPKHAAFHVEAGKVADAINSGKYAEATAMIENGTTFATASTEVGVAIVRLKKESGG